MAKFRFALFRAKRRDGTLYPKWRIRYFRDGEAILAESGYTDKGRTQDKAKDKLRELEHADHLQTVGAPQVKAKPLQTLVDMWLLELAASGGKMGYPASPQHVRATRSKMAWWIRTLKLRAPQDVNRAEAVAAARRLPISPATQDQYIQAVQSFLSWCFKNEFVGRNPLAGYRKQVSEPRFRRRPLTVDEALRLLASTPDRRVFAYKAALLTGLRLAELNSIPVSAMDWKAGSFPLEARSAKNRKPALIHLPGPFVEELYAFCAGRRLNAPLFGWISPSHAATTLQRDLERAQVPFVTAAGRVDFHALRVTFLTWINELGEDVKTVQELGRHADPRMTFGVYAKAREDRIREVVTRAGARLTETNPGIPRHGIYHAGVTHAPAIPGNPVVIGPEGVGRESRYADGLHQDKPSHSRTSPDIQDAKDTARHFFETATTSAIPGHSETSELSRRRHALLTQVTEALSRLPSEDLQAILDAIQGLGQGRITA